MGRHSWTYLLLGAPLLLGACNGESLQPGAIAAPATSASAGATSAVEVSLPARGNTRSVTLRGTVVVAGGQSPAGGSVRVVSVTPNNPFDRRVSLSDASYAIADVPTSCQYALIASVPGRAPKLRIDTLLSTAKPIEVRHFGGDTREDLLGSSYSIGVEWCSEDPTEVAAKTWLAGRALLDIPIYGASPLDTPTPAPSPMAGASTTPVVTTSPLPIFTAAPVTPCVAHIIKPLAPAGLELTPQQGLPEAGLVGDWGVTIPGAAWSTDLGSHVSFGSGLGELHIGADGTYAWSGATGKLRQVIPTNDAVPGVAYWLLADAGGRQHYLALTGKDSVTLYLPGTNLFAASGQRLGKRG